MLTAIAQEDSINSVITPNRYVCRRPFNHHYSWRTIDEREVCFRLRLGYIRISGVGQLLGMFFSVVDMSIEHGRIECCFLLSPESDGLFAINI